MNYNFTEGVRKALVAAREEAVRLQHDYVGSEHILLGLVRDPNSEAARLLNGFGARPVRVRAEVERRLKPGLRSVLEELPYTAQAKNVLEQAMQDGAERELEVITP